MQHPFLFSKLTELTLRIEKGSIEAEKRKCLDALTSESFISGLKSVRTLAIEIRGVSP